MKKTALLLSLSLIALAACDIYPPTPKPDYTINVVPTNDGLVAVPPKCPSWSTATLDPYDNQPLPQFGCANARSLAMMVERPADLLHGRPEGNGSGVMAVGAMRRYYGNQTRGLLDTGSSPDMATAVTTAPTTSSPLSGDVTGGGGSGGGSSSSSSSSGGSSGGGSLSIP